MKLKSFKKKIGKRKLNDFYIKYFMIKAGNDSDILKNQLKESEKKIVDELVKMMKGKMI